MAGAATCATTMALMTSTEYAAWRWATLERAQQPVWSSHDGVIDDDARCAISEIELPHPGAQAIGIAGIGHDGVDLGTGIGQGAREVAEAVRVTRHQGYPVAAHGEATCHGHSKARPRADQ
jgi:hypothetical protein